MRNTRQTMEAVRRQSGPTDFKTCKQDHGGRQGEKIRNHQQDTVYGCIDVQNSGRGERVSGARERSTVTSGVVKERSHHHRSVR